MSEMNETGWPECVSKEQSLQGDTTAMETGDAKSLESGEVFAGDNIGRETTRLEHCGETVTEIFDLPNGVLHAVFDLLGPKDLCIASAVCKEWRELNRDSTANQASHDQFPIFLSFPSFYVSYHLHFLHLFFFCTWYRLLSEHRVRSSMAKASLYHHLNSEGP